MTLKIESTLTIIRKVMKMVIKMRLLIMIHITKSNIRMGAFSNSQMVWATECTQTTTVSRIKIQTFRTFKELVWIIQSTVSNLTRWLWPSNNSSSSQDNSIQMLRDNTCLSSSLTPNIPTRWQWVPMVTMCHSNFTILMVDSHFTFLPVPINSREQ